MGVPPTGPPPIRFEPTSVYKSIRGPDAEKSISSGVEFWKMLFVIIALIVIAVLVVLALLTG